MLKASTPFFARPEDKYISFAGMTNSEWGSAYYSAAAYNHHQPSSVPSPPPQPVGQPLLNPQQQGFFDDFFEMSAAMVPSVNPASIFSEHGHHGYWAAAEQLPRNFLQSFQEMQEGCTSTTAIAAPGYHAVASGMSTPHHVELNPFNGGHELLHQPPRHLQMVSHQAPAMTGTRLLHFDSDPNFTPNGYHPPPRLEPVSLHDKGEDAHINVVRSALARTTPSELSTAIHSPVEIKNEQDTESESSPRTFDDAGSMSPQGIKRRAEADCYDEFQPYKGVTRTRSSEPATKKQKKAAQQKRDNLSEAQKRENHIHSEQKRRNLIKQGFDELIAMVPGLRTGSYSKKDILVRAADYMQDLKSGNKHLRIYLSHLESTAHQMHYQSTGAIGY